MKKLTLTLCLTITLLLGSVGVSWSDIKPYWVVEKVKSEHYHESLKDERIKWAYIRIYVPGKSNPYFARGWVNIKFNLCGRYMAANGILNIRQLGKKKGALLKIVNLPLGPATGETADLPLNQKTFFKDSEKPPIHWADIDGDGINELIYKKVCGNRGADHHLIYEYDDTLSIPRFFNPIDARSFSPWKIPQTTIETAGSWSWCGLQVERFESINGKYVLTELSYYDNEDNMNRCDVELFKQNKDGKLCLAKRGVAKSGGARWIYTEERDYSKEICRPFPCNFRRPQTGSLSDVRFWYNCNGTLIFDSSSKFPEDKYSGDFKHGNFHGNGNYVSANGSKYIGEFKNGKKDGQGIHYHADGTVFQEGIWENNKFLYASKPSPTVTAKKAPEPSSQVQKENERLRREIARLKRKNKQKPKPSLKVATSGSGFFVSKLGHVITNEHVVKKCTSVTVGDNAKKQVTANVVETDKRNDLALLKISSMEMASAETKSLVAKLGIKLTPLVSKGLLRSNEVELGEDVVVAGFPFGDIFSNTIKITKGIVSAKRGIGDNSGQFQIDAAVQKGNSGGPIYDENGNIIGVVVSQLNKLKVAKAIGTLPENVNFGVKASTVRQFLDSSGLPSKWSNRSKRISTKEIAQIAEKQTLMVMCYR